MVLYESGTLDETGNLRDAFPKHTTEAGSDPDLTVFTQYMLSETVFAKLSDPEEQDARRSELTAACSDIYRGQMPAGVAVVPFPWSANWQCHYMIRPGKTVQRRYGLPQATSSSLQIDVRLLFRGFPKYFLTKLEDTAGLDPAIADRVPLVTVAETRLTYSDTLAEEAWDSGE
ncbi:MAG TPA: hypothetical protein DFR83_15795 [Deltaproteobacteria bacterium]|nr:hypothetical protein [Deltaproteobacteria bacterium]